MGDQLVKLRKLAGQLQKLTYFERMVATGPPAHHAEHVFAALVGERM